MMDPAVRSGQETYQVTVTGDCTGCKRCIQAFECPAIEMDESGRAVKSASGKGKDGKADRRKKKLKRKRQPPPWRR
jgi:Fe-S-cluster-containing hydrogenase component 2